MKQYFLKAAGSIALAGLVFSSSVAQKNEESGKLGENQQIVIKKTGDKKTKVTVEINNGEVKVNGKPISAFDDDNLSIEIENEGMARMFPPNTPRSAFRYNNNGNAMVYDGNPKPLLGVMTDDAENGAKITTVTKGSAAEKAGLKAGDVIIKVNDTKVETAKALTETIAKFKPEQKINVTIRRDNKEETLAATLGKRAGATTIYSPDINLGNLDFRLDNPNFDASGFGFNRGRLGIKAQDTEDEKGVKVLEVDAESHAAKSGIKAGDIITKFDGEEVNSATELAEAARDAREKNTIPVTVTRDGKSQNIDIKIPKKLRTANL